MRTRSSRPIGSRRRLWPNELPRTAAKAIQVYVSNLRKAFGARGTRWRHGARVPAEGAAGRGSICSSSSGSWHVLRGRSRPIARRRSARLFRSGAERRSQTLRTSSSSSRRRRASRSCAGLRWRRGSRPSRRSDGAGARTRGSSRWSPSVRWRSARARSSCSPCTGRAGRPTLSTRSSAKASRCSTKSWVSSRASSFASSSRDPPPGPCAIGYGGGRAVQLDRRGIGATSRARATPSRSQRRSPVVQREKLILAQIVQPAEIASATRTLDEARRDLRARGGAVRVAAFSSSSPAEDVVRLTTLQDADLLLLATEEIPSSACSPWFSRRPLATSPRWSSGAGTSSRPDRRPLWRVRARLGGARARRVAATVRIGHHASSAPPTEGRRPRCQPSAGASSSSLHDRVVAEPLLGRPGQHGVSSSPREQGSSFSGCPSAGAQKGSGGLDLPSWPRLRAHRARTAWTPTGRDRAPGHADTLHLVARTVENRLLRCHEPEPSWPATGSTVSSAAAAWGSSTERPSSRSTGVALKLIAPELADDRSFRERFLRESRLAASLDHPGILPVYRGRRGRAARLYLATRYVDGSDLRAVLEEEGTLPPGGRSPSSARSPRRSTRPTDGGSCTAT